MYIHELFTENDEAKVTHLPKVVFQIKTGFHITLYNHDSY